MSNAPLRVALVYPPSRTQPHHTPPMGPLMLAAVLERAGHEVRLVDANAVHHRLDSEGVAREVAAFRPDVIGVTLVTPLAQEAYRLTGLLRPLGAPLLAGGPHATLLPEEPLAHGFDAVVVGEGEPVIAQAVEALAGRGAREDVPGLAWCGQTGLVHRTAPLPPPPDLDALPWPALHLADAARYDPAADCVLVMSSRGCPARCAYCAGGLFGRRFRFRSAENVVAELIERHRTLGARHFLFVDDSMGVNRERLREICRLLVEARLPVTWQMMTRVDSMDPGQLRLAAAAGCTRIDYGLESGSPETLRRIHKPHTLEMARQVVVDTAAAGIQPYVFFILGFPWEDPPALDETLALMRFLAPYVENFHPAIASILIPFPGTEIYQRYADQFGFAGWWLGGGRSYDAPRPETHAYHECVLYRNGAVLDADFFRYAAPVRRKIFEIFRFMYFHNLRGERLLTRARRKALFDLSVALSHRFPALERRLFGGLGRLRAA
jgi:magnesium-protoporphyrin IX monomethyl ester (oxidative) cyclase